MATPNMKSNVTELTTKVRYFDLDKFENDSVDVKYEYTDETDLEVAKSKVDDKEILEAINDILRRKAMMEARKNALPEGAADRKLVNDFVNSFAQLPPFDMMPANTKEEKNARRGKILNAIKQTPFILEGIKQKAKAAGVDTGNEPDSDSDSDEQ